MSASPPAYVLTYVLLCVRHPLHVLPPGATGVSCKFDMDVRGKFRMGVKVPECARAARLKSHLHTRRSIEEEPSAHTKRHLSRGIFARSPKEPSQKRLLQDACKTPRKDQRKKSHPKKKYLHTRRAFLWMNTKSEDEE